MERAIASLVFIAAFGFVAYEARSYVHAKRARDAAQNVAPEVAAQSSRDTGSARPHAATGGASRGSCVGSDLSLAWPIPGVAEKDWVIANYVDLDPATGRTADYTGATGDQAVTYDGHTGLDIEVPTFRAVDLGTPVSASADGVVEEFYDESYDRNMSCPKDEKWNFVRLRHDNGFATIYAHLRKNSVVVTKGQRVTAGQKLGLVGSSGCSVYPHVHLEVLDCQERTLEPLKEKMFRTMPAYSRSAPTTLMETSIFQPSINDIKQVQDPGVSDIHEVSVGFSFSVGVTLSHLHKGDVLLIEFLTPSNSRADFDYSTVIDRDYLRSSWWADFKLNAPGSWLAQIRVNGRLVGDRAILAQGAPEQN